MRAASTPIATVATRCPRCGQHGKRVSHVTLRSLLRDEYAAGILPTEYNCCDTNGGCKPLDVDTGWRFCDSPICDVVYFSEADDREFSKSQLHVAVGVKEQAGERPLCYCFGHSVASIQEELRAKGRSDALNDIRAKMKDPGCHCETSNPSGTCCLGSVARGIDIARKELGMGDVPELVSQPSRPLSNRGESIAKVGTVISAVAASSCCWLPLVLLAVGVSGAGIAATLEAYRPVFIVITTGFLATAFYFTYRPKSAAIGQGHACCAGDAEKSSDACCAPFNSRTFSLMSVNKITLWLVTALAVGFLFFPHYVGTLLGANGGPVVNSDMNRAVVKIEGMTCEGCAAVAAQSLRGVPGVLAVKVNYERGEAVLGVDADNSPSREDFITALKKVGYVGRMEAHPPIDPARELVFQVEKLGCPLIQGVGCGHLLAPTLARIDDVDGVAGSFSNWTGSLIRVSVAPDADREAVAERVQALLAADQQEPVQFTGDDLVKRLNEEEWRRVNRISDLTSYEFSTFAKHQINAFADGEHLHDAQRKQLLDLVDELWGPAAEGLENRQPGAEAYAEYWQNRLQRFIATYAEQAGDVLPADQVEMLIRLASSGGAPRENKLSAL